MREVVEPATVDAVADVLSKGNVSVGGGRYCAGGQPFLTMGRLLDTRKLDDVVVVNPERGTITVQAGIRWTALMEAINADAPGWAIRQKQSGAQRVTLGGTLAVNAHGRCLTAPPIVDDIESIDVLIDGKLVRCSRIENADRFARVIGGYGLFGVMTAVTLKLVPRVKQMLRVEVVPIDEAVARLDEAAARGATHGDFQYNVDDTSADFLKRGLLVTYEAADDADPVRSVGAGNFTQLATLAHVDKPRAWALYRQQMLTASGAVNWNDAWQVAEYDEHYHRHVESAIGAPPGSEVLSEMFVPRESLSVLLGVMAAIVRRRGANIIYGNVRLIEPDTVTRLPWARGRYACVVFNQHIDQTLMSIALARDTFRDILDAVLELGGTFYLAHHTFAAGSQVDAAYPGLRQHLASADGGVRSDWLEKMSG